MKEWGNGANGWRTAGAELLPAGAAGHGHAGTGPWNALCSGELEVDTSVCNPFSSI